MGVSIAVASAIMFTTFVILFAIVFGAVDELQSNALEAESDHYDAERYFDDMSISLVTVNTTSNEITLLNDGGVSIDTNDVDVLINGTYVASVDLTLDVDGAIHTKIWGPGEKVTIALNQDLNGKRIKISILGESPVYHFA